MQCKVDDIKVNAINIQFYTIQHINAEYNIQFTLKFTYYRRRGVEILPLLVIYYYEEEGTFQWANGDPFTFTQWGEGEPNNSGDEVIFTNFVYLF